MIKRKEEDVRKAMQQEEDGGKGDRRSRALASGGKQEVAFHLCPLSLGHCSLGYSEQRHYSPLRGSF